MAKSASREKATAASAKMVGVESIAIVCLELSFVTDLANRCLVCTNDKACSKLFPGDDYEGVCYKGGVTVKENFQMCDVKSMDPNFSGPCRC